MSRKGAHSMKNDLTYSRNGDYLIPNLTLDGQPERDIGKYGRMRKKYLEEHDPILWGILSVEGTLFSHLLEIEDAANARLEQMMPGLAKAAGATEELKNSDPLRWAGLMNTCKAQAEEVILAELIYA